MSRYSKMTEEQKKIHQARTSLRGLERKEKLVELAGGKCCGCGYSKCTRSMQFHHKVPSEKKFDLTVVNIRCKDWKEVLEEASKCLLFCGNCHGEEEDRLAKERFLLAYKDLIEEAKGFTRWSDVLRVVARRRKDFLHEIEKICPKCEKKFKTKYDFKYCSAECRNISGRKVERPSKEELQKFVDSNTPWTRLGKHFGVSDSAVKKWARAYGIDFKGRRQI